MRHVVLTLAAFAVSVPAAHAHPAQPAAPTVSTTRQRLAQLLANGKRTDAQAISHVVMSLTTDPDATVRRLAALVLERMIDASTATVVRDFSIAALRFAQSDTDLNVQRSAAKVLATLTNLAQASSAATTNAISHSTPTGSALPAVVAFLGVPACVSNAPVIVGAKNLSTQPFDLCAAFNRAATRVAWPSSLSTASPIALRVMLVPFVNQRKAVRCHLKVAAFYAGTQSSLTASAMVTHSGLTGDIRSAEKDCVEALIENLITTKLLPALQRTGSSTSTSGSATPGSPTTAGSSSAGSTPSAGTSTGIPAHDFSTQ